ncbi:hypothetical protein ACG04R_10005 [Roseateles sp. BYS78W]|uniref:Uncharacterized protein n=1 Tax=Pelomonas candidula TaxID=3299025 RepID=A0ABW7HB82_9BURK
MSVPLVGICLAGCGARERRQGEVFAAYLCTLAGVQPFPAALPDWDLPNEAFEPAPRSIHRLVESRVAAGWQRWGWKSADELRKTLPDVQPTAAFDLMSRVGSTEPVHIPPALLPPAVSVDYVSPAVLKSIFDGTADGWSRFHERFPRGGLLTAFSPVGFSADGSQAVFYADVSCGSLCGSGYGVLMHRVKAGWQVADHRQLWVS